MASSPLSKDSSIAVRGVRAFTSWWLEKNGRSAAEMKLRALLLVHWCYLSYLSICRNHQRINFLTLAGGVRMITSFALGSGAGSRSTGGGLPVAVRGLPFGRV
jgi:hypothetical protein